MDGKHYLLKDAVIGVNSLPFHPRCRCTTIPYFDDEFTENEERAYRGEDEKTHYTKAKTYEEWKKEFVKEKGQDAWDLYEKNTKNEKVNRFAGEKYASAGENRFTSKSNSGTIISGARITDIYSEEAEEFAESFYAEVKKKSTDYIKIAERLNLSQDDVKSIKNYLFIDKSYYDKDLDVWRKFDPDCSIAHSWQRLAEGKKLEEHDYTLIKHELYEMKLKKDNPNITHEKAHELATRKYNYQKEAEEYYDKFNKHRKE